MGAPRDDLRLLSIFHYILSGLTALFSLFPLLHVGIGIAMLAGALDGPGGGRGNAPPPIIGWMFIVIGAAVIVGGLGFAVMLFLAARFLRAQRHWIFVLVVAALSCAFMPFGTVLGVFTIVTLTRPEVKALFQGAAPAPVSPPNAWS
ncbi:hypothetical protein [Anaeromyxobacter oryzae]|uniref:Uncharacterized protein n=1 Tax=Anaeromyxobacter oryzae TaxID=2918170 RepID=A0ABN6MSF5_9BACT|nr:hypothetical protein [Anaeromyxobacter oryzae]BDG03917.1 hypothetical protein AMOR_29130 [Anaeromyxobacter oryzae]